MKAVVFHEFGGLDVLRVEEVDDPRPGPGEVLIEIAAARSTTSTSTSARASRASRSSRRSSSASRSSAGSSELGEGVDGWDVGDRVMPYLMDTCGGCRYCRTGRESLCLAPGFISFSTSGGYAEKLVCPVGHLIRIPDELSDEDAAALQVAFGTAWHMLFTRGRLALGETVMINSVGSGIGSAAVQLAQLAGAIRDRQRELRREARARGRARAWTHGINHTTAGRRRPR